MNHSNSSSSINNHTVQDKNKIIGFTSEELDIIINGNIEDMVRLSDPNKIGQVVDKLNNVLSDITQLIMIVNSSPKGWRDIASALIKHGANPDMRIDNYYGRSTTAREIANTYRNGL